MNVSVASMLCLDEEPTKVSESRQPRYQLCEKRYRDSLQEQQNGTGKDQVTSVGHLQYALLTDSRAHCPTSTVRSWLEEAPLQRHPVQLPLASHS